MRENSTRPDVLQVQGRMSRGYGIIPKIPMQDNRLTIEAKAIYSYFCTYAGAGTTAFPSRSKILYDLQIGETRYYKHFKLLKQYGYIKVEQNTDSAGKFRNNIYTLVEMIEPHPQNRGTEKPCPHFEDTDNAYTENEGTKSNILKINNFKSNTEGQSHSQGQSHTEQEQKADLTLTIDSEAKAKEEIPKIEKELPKTPKPASEGFQRSTSTISINNYSQDDYIAYKTILQENIGYSDFLVTHKFDIELVNELLDCMLDVICTDKPTVKINGEEKSRSMVKSQYLKVNYLDIEHVLDRYKDQRHKITHVHAYLKTMLYTCKQENGHYYTNAVRVDGLVH
jgi:hypothetical protein